MVAYPKISELSGKFTSLYGVNTEDWELINEPEIVSGRLRLGPAQGLLSKKLYDMSDSQAYARVEKSGDPFKFTTVFVTETGEGLAFKVDGEILYTQYTKAGEVIDHSVRYDETKQGYWRIRERFGVALWETSEDGLSWDIQYQVPHGIDLTAGRFLMLNLVDISFGEWLFGNGVFGGGDFSLSGFGYGPFGGPPAFGGGDSLVEPGFGQGPYGENGYGDI